jgi:hypothetical protein
MCILRGTNSISGYLKLELHPCNTVQARIGLHNISSMKYNLLLGVLGRLIRTARLWIVVGLLRANINATSVNFFLKTLTMMDRYGKGLKSP